MGNKKSKEDKGKGKKDTPPAKPAGPVKLDISGKDITDLTAE
jgi:hypothetical protein